MIASLMMYQRPELEAANNRYWNSIRTNLADAGIDSPKNLSQDAEEFSVWKHPDLVLSQTCGMPYRIWLHDKVELVGTPDFGVEDCPPGYYRSALVVRADDAHLDVADFKNKVFAYNQTFSQSGFAGPYWHLEPKGFWFENLYHAEQHLESARAVAENRADIAALDIVSWKIISRYEDFARKLHVLELTAPTPGLPLITAKDKDPNTIFAAVENAVLQMSDPDRDLLSLQGIVRISKEQYLEVPNPPIESYNPNER